MPDAQLTNKLSPRETLRPHCPMCEAKMEVLRVVAGRPGFENRTLKCTKCRTIRSKGPRRPAQFRNYGLASQWIDPASIDVVSGGCHGERHSSAQEFNRSIEHRRNYSCQLR